MACLRFPDPRRLLQAVRCGLGAVFLLTACARAEPVELDVFLPDPGYKKADGTILAHDAFKETRIMWGTCDAGNDLLELKGEVSVPSWKLVGRITVVPNEPTCIVAVVIGLDGQPMGRSDPERFYARPGALQSLHVG